MIRSSAFYANGQRLPASARNLLALKGDASTPGAAPLSAAAKVSTRSPMALVRDDVRTSAPALFD